MRLQRPESAVPGPSPSEWKPSANPASAALRGFGDPRLKTSMAFAESRSVAGQGARPVELFNAVMAYDRQSFLVHGNPRSLFSVLEC